MASLPWHLNLAHSRDADRLPCSPELAIQGRPSNHSRFLRGDRLDKVQQPNEGQGRVAARRPPHPFQAQIFREVGEVRARGFVAGRSARFCSKWGQVYSPAMAAGARRVPLPLTVLGRNIKGLPQALHALYAPLTNDYGASAHQPDLFLECHPLRGARARARARGRRGHRAGVPAPAWLLYVACHVAVPPHPSSLRYPVCPARRQYSVGRFVCRCARGPRSPGQRPQAGACAGTGPGPPGAPGRLDPGRDGRRAGRQPPPPSPLKGTPPAPPQP